MKTINLIFYFPNDWYQLRSVKIRTNGKIIDKIKYANETVLNISDDINEFKFSIDFYTKKLDITQIKNESYGVVYFKIKNFTQLINPKILRIKTFKTKLERQEFCNNLYLDFGKTTPVKNKDKVNLALGLMISTLLILTPFYPNSNFIVQEIGSQNVNLPFVLGIGGIVSYTLMFLNKSISSFSYKSRIYTSIFGFFLSLFYLNSTTLIICIVILTSALLIRSLYEFKKVNDLSY